MTVTTGARLHFGPLAVAAPAGGKFGGVGVMIATPRIVLAACHAEFDDVCGDTIAVARVVEFRDRFRDAVTERRVPRCKIIVREAFSIVGSWISNRG